MSMLSAQCDELRTMAAMLVVRGLPEVASVVRDAADTIWELRCKLVDAEDRVRKSGEPCKLCEREDENAKLRDENSMLRKYASKALSEFSYCDRCPYFDCGCDTETVPMHEGCKAFEELRELGVEVDDGSE